MATTTTTKRKAPLICQKEVLGYQLQQPAPALAREIETKTIQNPTQEQFPRKNFPFSTPLLTSHPRFKRCAKLCAKLE